MHSAAFFAQNSHINVERRLCSSQASKDGTDTRRARLQLLSKLQARTFLPELQKPEAKPGRGDGAVRNTDRVSGDRRPGETLPCTDIQHAPEELQL